MKTAMRWACALVLLLGLPAWGQVLPTGITEVRKLGAVTEYQLDNGLQLLLMPQAGAPRASVTVTYRVGSRHEANNEAGMAHLLEHVTFRGTRRIADLGAEMQRLGVSFNGTTSLDRTNYFGSFAANDALLRQLLQLEASRMSEARLAVADFDKEKPIVLNEMGLRGGATVRQMNEALSAAAFRQHPYGRPVIGYTADIEQLSLPALRAFYERHYRPDNAVLMLAGGFDPAQALTAVADIFGPLPRPVVPLAALALTEPAQQAPRVMTLRTRETALAVGYRIPGMAHEHTPALMVLNQLLPRVGSRLTRDGRERPFTQTLLSHTGLTRDPFLLGLLVQLPTTPSGDAAALELIEGLEENWLYALQNLRRDAGGERLVRQLADDGARRLREGLQDPARAPALISDAIGAGDWRLPFKLLDGLGTLKPAEVFKQADLYLRPENRSVARGVTDASVHAPEFKEIALTGFAGLFSKPIEVAVVTDPAAGVGELKPLDARTAGDAFETDPAVLDKAARRYQLPSGLLLGVLAKNSADERVTALLRLRWGKPGDTARLQGWRVLGRLLADGAAGRSADQIRQLKTKLQAEINVFSSAQSLLVTVTAKPATLLPILLLVKEMLSEPTLPDAAFRREQTLMLAQLASAARAGAAAPDGTLERERQARMQQQGLQLGDAGYTPSNAELTAIWQQLTVDDARQFQRNFWSGNDAVLSVVGPVPEQLMSLAETLFGIWKKPAAPPYEPYGPPQVPETGAAARFVSPARGARQGSAQVVLHQELALNRWSDDHAPLLIGSRILASPGTSGSRLTDRLRAQDATSYAVSARLRVPGEGDRAGLRLQASAAPAATARVEAAMKEEIDRLLAEGVTEAEVASVREQLRLQRRQRLSSDAGLAGALIDQFDRRNDFSSSQAQDDAALEAATPERVLQVLRKLLRPDGWVVVVSE